MGSRSKWEDMIGSAQKKIAEVLEKPPKEKAQVAADKLGGMSGNAVDAIKKRKEEQAKALRETY